MRFVSFATSVSLLLALSATAGAQDTGPRGYAQGALVLTIQPDGTPYHYHLSGPLGGSGVGVSGAAGYFITPSIAIEAEVLFAGEISVPQAFGYMNDSDDYTATFRAVTVNGLVRWKPGGWRPVEFVAGGGVASIRYGRRDLVRTDYFPPVTRTSEPDYLVTDIVANLTGGADLVLPMRSRAAFVGSARVRWRQRSSQDDYFGVIPIAADLGVGLRVRF
jgi:hypothetical protein